MVFSLGGENMPRGDGTGPSGMGPLTGRGAGLCNGYDTPGFRNAMPGRVNGLGQGRGIRRFSLFSRTRQGFAPRRINRYR